MNGAVPLILLYAILVAQATFILFYIDIFWRGLYINYIKQVWHHGRFL